MPTPYYMDFMDTITNVHFGSQWMFIWSGTFTDQPDTVSATFPQIAGGTPGFTLATASIPPVPPRTSAGPRKLVALDLSHQLKTEAGAPLTAFWLTQQNVPALGPTGRGSQIFIALNQLLPPTPFKVKIFSANADSQAAVGTINMNAMKPGILLDAAGPFTASNPVFQIDSFSGVSENTIIVDPVTLEVRSA